jgi:hypothetical protein
MIITVDSAIQHAIKIESISEEYEFISSRQGVECIKNDLGEIAELWQAGMWQHQKW